MRIVLTLLMACWTSIAVAQSFPEARSPFVNDFAEIIDDQTEARITEQLRNLRADKGVEMTVVTINSFADYEGTPQTRREFTTALFNHWGVGDAEKNNGILMLISLAERDVFIGLGSSYPASYDDRMDRVFDQFMKSNFRNGNYNKGVSEGVTETIARTAEGWQPEKSKFDLELIPFIVFAICGVLLYFRQKLSDLSARFRVCPNCGRRRLTLSRSRLEEPTIGTRGSDMVLTECGNCEYRDERRHILPIRSSSSGSSGGFGGGSSSGGGGGGRW